MAQVPERCMQMLKQIITEIENRQNITRDQLALLLETTDTGDIAFLHERARKTADAIYGKQVFIRGLIEFTNYCKNDCIYCGIRKSNRKAERYRLTEEEILSCCANGYELGFRTFVLQGGEDPYFTDDKICALIRQIKAQYPDCAVTLSIGEKEHDSYQAFFDAGADRYLLRHETADEAHYGKLHPAEMFWKHRMDCLWDLKEIGYQVGCGFMVGSPEQTVDTLYEDLHYGLKVHEGALARGVKVTGATVHFVDEGTDTGPIILQKAVEVQEGDTPEILQRRVMEQAEWKIMPQAIDLIANGKVTVTGKTVHISK